MTVRLRLGVNIDHVATLRNARGGRHPDPLRAARVAVGAGADSIVAHLREDRRHILDADVEAITAEIDAPLNFEMAATEEMTALALRLRPFGVCIVPERRAERTTEGGLDAVAGFDVLTGPVRALTATGTRVSLFVEAERRQLDAARALGADAVELHTGAFCEAGNDHRADALARIVDAARHAAAIGLECHAGHGLTYDTVGPIAAIPEIVELNIGHFLVGEAVFVGFEESIRQMRAIMDAARAGAEAAAAR